MSYNYKQRTKEIIQMPTLQEVLETEEGWVRAHAPVDRGTKLNQFRFESVLAEKQNFYMNPFANVITDINPSNLPVPVNNSLTTQPLSLTNHALDQLLAKIDLPKRTFFRYPPSIQNILVNYPIQNEKGLDKDVLLRIIDGNSVRAMMGKVYNPFDNTELIRAVIPFCPVGSKLTCAYNDELTMHLSIIFPNTRTEVRVGDIIESGIYIRNSEVGISSVTIASYTYRLICSNGAITGGDDGGFFRFRHTGDSNVLREAAKASIESTYLQTTKITEMIKQSVNIAIAQPLDELEKLCSTNNLSQDDYKKMMQNFFAEPDPTLYGVFNAVTATARDKDGEESYELARIATKALQSGLNK